MYEFDIDYTSEDSILDSIERAKTTFEHMYNQSPSGILISVDDATKLYKKIGNRVLFHDTSVGNVVSVNGLTLYICRAFPHVAMI